MAELVLLRWASKPRLNYIDIAWLGLSYGLAMSGHYWMVAVTVFVGLVLSVLAEIAAGWRVL